MNPDEPSVAKAADRSKTFWTWYNAKHPSSEKMPDALVPDIPKQRGRRLSGYAITGSGKRKPPSVPLRREILARQKNRCMYCEHPLGSTVFRKGKPVILRLNWDHFIPYAYGRTNAGTNWIAACHVCNGIKSARMFDTVMEAQKYILTRWIEKGYVLRSPLALAMEEIFE